MSATDDEVKGKVQVVDTFTGEVFDYTWENVGQLRLVHEQLKALESALKRAREKCAKAVEQFMEDQEAYDFGDGKKFMWIAGTRKTYKPEVVKEYLDEDQFSLVIDVNGKRLKELMANLVQEGVAPAGAWKAIEDQADVTPIKPYVKLEKA